MSLLADIIGLALRDDDVIVCMTGGAARYGETVTLTAVEAANVTGTPDAAFPSPATTGETSMS